MSPIKIKENKPDFFEDADCRLSGTKYVDECSISRVCLDDQIFALIETK